MENISWKDRKTNEYELEALKKKRRFFKQRIRKKKTMDWIHLEVRESCKRSD